MEMYEGKMLFAEFDNQWNAAEDGLTKHSQEYSQDTRHKQFTHWGHKIHLILLLYMIVEERCTYFQL